MIPTRITGADVQLQDNVKLEVADFCTAVRVDNKIYYYDSTQNSGSKFVERSPAEAADGWT